jgi:hypothetical protein
MKFLRALAVLAICMGVASAQVTPVIPTGTVLGNSSGSAAVASPLTTLPPGLLATPGTIGGTTPAPATFTNLTASGTVAGSGFSSYLSTYLAAPAAIGGTTPAAASFTTLASTQAANIADALTQSANTEVDGITMFTATAATSGNAYYSPAIHLRGAYWTGSVSAPTDWQIYGVPSSGTSSFLVFTSSINSGAYNTNASLNSRAVWAGAGYNLSTTISANNCPDCFYYQATNNPAISANSTEVLSFTSSLTSALVPIITGTTPFTVSGCGTAGSVAGTGTTGTFTVGTGASTCTFIFTINGATGMTAVHGWIANVDDLTKNTHCTNTSGGSTTTAEVLCNFVVATSDIITFHADPY